MVRAREGEWALKSRQSTFVNIKRLYFNSCRILLKAECFLKQDSWVIDFCMYKNRHLRFWCHSKCFKKHQLIYHSLGSRIPVKLARVTSSQLLLPIISHFLPSLPFPRPDYLFNPPWLLPHTHSRSYLTIDCLPLHLSLSILPNLTIVWLTRHPFLSPPSLLSLLPHLFPGSSLYPLLTSSPFTSSSILAHFLTSPGWLNVHLSLPPASLPTSPWQHEIWLNYSNSTALINLGGGRGG